jgi:hypothetical protein
MVSLFISGACSNKKSIEDKLVSDNSVSQQIVYEENRPYVKYQSFQNPDSTWGFTIFVNSRPFLLYKKIPVNRAKFGFESRKDAETVAEIFVKMIQNGNLKPSIDLNALDTLGINFKNRKMPG